MPSTIPRVTHALTVREPWAWALSTGIKSVENRTWAFPQKKHPLPCWIAIHASLSYETILPDSEDMFAVHSMIEPEFQGGPERCAMDGRVCLAASEIVGVMQVVDCFDQTGIDDDNMTPESAERMKAGIDRPLSCRMAPIDRLEWPCGSGFAWIVGDVYRFYRPIVAIGRLNVWQMAPALQMLVAKELKRSMAEQVESIDRSRPFDKSVIYEMPKISTKQKKLLYG